MILDKISIGDIAGYAQYKYCNMNEYTSYVACSKAVSGSINNQTVISEYIQNGPLRSRENVCTSSSGLVAFGEIAYNFDSTNTISKSTTPYVGKYDYYRCPSKVTFDEANYTCKADYDQGKYTWSAEKMIERVSFVPEFPFGYNINNKSIKEGSWDTKDYKKRNVSFNNRVEVVDGNYVFYLNLNRVYLREFMMSDLLDVYEYCSNPNVGPNAGWKEHKSIEETRRILISMINEKENFAIVNKANNKVIGSIGLYKDFKRENPYCKMIGYVLNESYWGKGIMSEVLRGIINYVFNNSKIIIINSIFPYANILMFG